MLKLNTSPLHCYQFQYDNFNISTNELQIPCQLDAQLMVQHYTDKTTYEKKLKLSVSTFNTCNNAGKGKKILQEVEDSHLPQSTDVSRLRPGFKELSFAQT